MDAWEKAFVEYIAPQLTTRGLRALYTALTLAKDLLIGDYITFPKPTPNNEDKPVQYADPIALAIWKGERLSTVCEVEQRWYDVYGAAIEASGDANVLSYFCNWFDTSTPSDSFPKLARVVNQILQARFDAASAEMVAQN